MASRFGRVALRRNIRFRTVRLQIAPTDRAAIEDAGVQRIGRRVSALAPSAEGLPIAHGDLAELAAASHADGAAVLLRARDPVRKTEIRRDMVNLRCRLVQPRAPLRRICRAVQRDDGALIARDDHDVGVRRTDPQLVIIVAAGRSSCRPGVERPSAIGRFLHADVGDEHDVRVFWIDGDLLEVPAAPPHARVARCLHPRGARIVRAEEAPFFRVNHRVDAARIARRDRDAAPAEPFGWKARQLIPTRAAVGRFVDAAAGTVRRRIGVPRRPARVPQARVHHLRVRRIDGNVDRADAVVLVQNPFPRFAAVCRSVDAALRVRRIEMTDCRHEDDVRVLRIHGDAADVVGVVESDVRPGNARIDRLVHAVAVADRIAERRLTTANVNRVGTRRRHGERADRGDRLRIEHGRPGAAGVHRFPDAAVHGSEIELVRPSGHAAHGIDTASAERAQHAPPKP